MIEPIDLSGIRVVKSHVYIPDDYKEDILQGKKQSPQKISHDEEIVGKTK